MAKISYDVDAKTVILDGRVMSNFIAGTTVQITFPNPDTSRFIAKRLNLYELFN